MRRLIKISIFIFMILAMLNVFGKFTLHDIQTRADIPRIFKIIIHNV